jgi:hypothetical protein
MYRITNIAMAFIPIFIIKITTPKTPRDTGLSGGSWPGDTIHCNCGFWCLKPHARDILIVCPRCATPFDLRSDLKKLYDRWMASMQRQIMQRHKYSKIA